MKNHFEEEDLVCGKVLIRNTSNSVIDSPGFAMSVAFMLGFRVSRDEETQTLISISDGWVQKFETRDGLKNMLNEDDHGYRFATKDEVFRMMVYKYRNEPSVDQPAK